MTKKNTQNDQIIALTHACWYILKTSEAKNNTINKSAQFRKVDICSMQVMLRINMLIYKILKEAGLFWSPTISSIVYYILCALWQPLLVLWCI